MPDDGKQDEEENRSETGFEQMWERMERSKHDINQIVLCGCK